MVRFQRSLGLQSHRLLGRLWPAGADGGQGAGGGLADRRHAARCTGGDGDAGQAVQHAGNGGITRGDEVAKGIVEAMRRVELRAPIVIRLDGTNADAGRQILLDAGIPASKLISKPTMLEAARAAVDIANAKVV